jgi:Zn-dependent metalloprotease
MKFKLLAAIVMSIGFSCATFAQVSSNEGAAREWIKANSREMNIQPIHTFKLSFVRKGPAGETLRFQQMLNDVPVIGSEIVVNFSNENKVAFSSNSYDEKIANINTNPSISKSAAISISNNDLRFKDFITFQEAKLGVKNIDGVTKLVYRVVTNAHDLTGSWEVIVDANTSAILSKKDIAVYYHNKGIDQDKTKNKENTRNKKSVLSTNFVGGTAYVFNPDPLSQAHAAYAGNYSSPASGTYPNDTDATNTSLDAARSLVTLPEIDFTSGVYKLKSTYAEIKELEAPSKGLFTQSTPDFLFNRSQDNFEAVNAFYHIDNSLRYINETLGISCVPLTNNGVLYFDPSGVNGDDNSYYTSGTLTFGEGGVDDAEDADVILHELGHGLHDWITGGNSSSSTGLGEGSGDYWAMSYSRSLNQWASTDAAYNWVFSWDGHNEWWNGRVTNYTRTYPQTSATYTEIHEYGQIWATALMKIYDVIGRTKMDTAFLEGLALTNGTSNQKTAATAVRQAAINMNYPCADIQTMTTKFNAAGYALTALPLTMAPISNQTVQADASNTYTLPSYATLANPIVANCSATLTQTPVIGTVLAPGVYTITMVATSGTSVTRTFQLTVTPYLGVLDVTKNNIILYPNPATTVLNVKGDFDSNESITVYNVLGQVVMVKKISSTEESISIANLAKGVYNIHFNTLNATYKFVKE